MRVALILGGLGVAVAGWVIYMRAQPPEGVETMSGADATTAWIGLGAALVGLATAVVNLVATLRK